MAKEYASIFRRYNSESLKHVKLSMDKQNRFWPPKNANDAQWKKIPENREFALFPKIHRKYRLPSSESIIPLQSERKIQVCS